MKVEFNELCDPVGDGNFSPEQKAHIFAVGGDRVNSQPQVIMMNTLMLRTHNRIAGKISAANPAWDDDRVFETTRNPWNLDMTPGGSSAGSCGNTSCSAPRWAAL